MFLPSRRSEHDVAPELRKWITSRTVIVSILAGVETSSLRQRFQNVGAIVRAMPNLPVAIRRGVTALYTEDADEALKQVGLSLAEIAGMSDD